MLTTSDRFAHLSPAKRIEAERREAAKLNAAAARFSKQIGFEPEVGEVAALLDELAAAGLLLPKAEAAARGLLSVEHREGILIALKAALDGSRELIATRAVQTAGRLFGTARFGLAAITPGVEGRRSLNGIVSLDGQLLQEFVAREHGLAGIYVGRDPRKGDLGRNTAAETKDVSESRHAVLDFDIPKDGKWSWADWTRRVNEIAGRMRPLDPLALVMTGGGLHAWFRLAPSDDPAEMARRAALFRETARAIGADPAPCAAQSILRLWPTINPPKANKRGRGQRLALVKAAHENPSATAHDPDELSSRLLAAFGAEALAPVAARAYSRGTGRGGADLAPSPEMADRALLLLPNPKPKPEDKTNGSLQEDQAKNPFGDRIKWVGVAYAHGGAGGTLEAWLKWCADFKGDPDEDERVWRTLPPDEQIGSGFRHLLALVNAHADPVEAERLRRDLARDAFADDELDDQEIARLDAVQGGDELDDKKSARRDSRERANHRERAFQELERAGLACWQTPEGRGFATVNGRHLSLKSHAGKNVIQGILARANIWLPKTARGELEAQLEGRASVGPIHKAHVRAAFDASANRLVLDIGDDTGRAVIVDGAAGAWTVAPCPAEIRFWRPPSQAPLPLPVDDGAGADFFARLRHIANLPASKARTVHDAGTQADAALLLGLCSWLVPVGEAAMLVLTGPNGTGKTSMARLLSNIADPSGGGVGRLSTEQRDLFVVARSRLVMPLDNVSELPGDAADTLCQLLTGADMPRRGLHTDEEIVHLQARAGLIVTSVLSDLIHRPDLADRGVSLRLAPLILRRTDADLNATFERSRPQMFAALLDMLAMGLRDRAAVEREWGGTRTIRLLDAATLAEAAARGIGWPKNLMIDAVEAVRRSAVGDMLDADPVAVAVCDLLDKQTSWKGTARTLLSELGFHGYASRHGQGPKSERGLTAALDRLVQPLKERGIVFERTKSNDRNRTRMLVLRREDVP